MQALILAAGRGSRLGNKSQEIPKCLLQVGTRCMVEHQLEMLAEAGVAPVGMVVGYSADDIREVVGIRAEYIENPRWNTTNSLYSFALAKEWVSGSVVVLNSDILVHPGILEKLLQVEGDALAYDSTSGDAREHMKVKVKDGKLIDMSKQMSAEESCGENVGLLKFTASSAKTLFEIADALVEEGGENNWVGSAVRVLAERQPLKAVDIAGLPWGEVDSAFDLDRTRKQVLPAIERDLRARRSKPRKWGKWAGLAATAALFLFLAARALWLTPEVIWSTLPVATAESTTIRNGERVQNWWLVHNGKGVNATVNGPAMVRVDSRLLLDKSGAAAGEESTPYVVEIAVDGKRLDWFKWNNGPSLAWRHDKRPVSQRGRTDFEIPHGSHEVGVRLVATGGGDLLVRVRRLVDSGDDD